MARVWTTLMVMADFGGGMAQTNRGIKEHISNCRCSKIELPGRREGMGMLKKSKVNQVQNPQQRIVPGKVTWRGVSREGIKQRYDARNVCKYNH
jgi:hypothetical protein